jgi:hypothetical protein
LNARLKFAWSNAEGFTLEALDMCFWLRFCDQQTVRDKRKGGVSDCIETPRSYVVNSLRERSKHPSVRGGYRFLIIRFAVQNTLQKPSKTLMLRSSEVEAVKVHYLVPHRYKVVQKLLLGVLTSVDFRQGSELGVRTEDEVDTGAGPLEFARCAITTLEHVFVFRGWLPHRAHVEQIHEEVIGERLWPLGEDAVLGLFEVGIQDAHTANENRHLRSGQCQQLCPINQQFLRRYGVFGFEVVTEPVCSRFEYGE